MPFKRDRRSGPPDSPGPRGSPRPAAQRRDQRGQERYRGPGKDVLYTLPPRPSPATKSRSGGSIPQELTDAARGERLQKVMAQAGVASRRACEELIAAGRVTVNGQVVSALPAWVDPFKDRVEVDGEPIARPRRAHVERIHHVDSSSQGERGQPRVGSGVRPRGGASADARGANGAATTVPAGGFVYVALHKPKGVITTANDPAGRPSVGDYVKLPPELARRVFPVGRLDADSTGLLLMTNDGELTNRLTHPRYGVEKQYMIAVRGRITPQEIERLKVSVNPPGSAPGSAHVSAAGSPSRNIRPAPSSRSDDDRSAGDHTAASPTAAKRAAMENVRILGVDHDREGGDRTRLMITLRKGQNREIRRTLALLGFKVRKLLVVGIGPVSIKGIASGQWRLLTPVEVTRLKRAAGMSA